MHPSVTSLFTLPLDIVNNVLIKPSKDVHSSYSSNNHRFSCMYTVCVCVCVCVYFCMYDAVRNTKNSLSSTTSASVVRISVKKRLLYNRIVSFRYNKLDRVKIWLGLLRGYALIYGVTCRLTIRCVYARVHRTNLSPVYSLIRVIFSHFSFFFFFFFLFHVYTIVRQNRESPVNLNKIRSCT